MSFENPNTPRLRRTTDLRDLPATSLENHLSADELSQPTRAELEAAFPAMETGVDGVEELPTMESMLTPPSLTETPTSSLSAHPDGFYLERLVHHLLKADRRTGWEQTLIHEMTQAGIGRLEILENVVWPTMECLVQLRGDEMLSERRLNVAMRLLRTMTEEVIAGLPVMDGGSCDQGNARSIMIFAGPGERSELGAHMLSQLAERCGWKTYFAGANLTSQEILFAVGQLEPDVLLIHATQCRSRAGLWRLLKELQKSRVWPARQVAVCGTAAGQPDANPEDKRQNASRTNRSAYDLPADLMAIGPVEILELLALSPEYRRPREAGEALQLGNPFLQATMPSVISTTAIREMMARYLGRESGHVN